MIRPLALAALAYAAASLLAATVWAVVAPRLLRDEDAPLCPSTHWDDETCPGCDPGPDDLEAVARVTGLVVFNAPTLLEALVEQAVEGETCPDYPHEIVWSKS